MQAKMEEETPANHMKVKKVLRYVNLDEENPETTDVSRLKLISARKRWKLLHGFKLKKRNKRLEQKGVFETWYLTVIYLTLSIFILSNCYMTKFHR